MVIEITPKEAKKMLADGQVTILDIRAEDAYDAEHIPQAEHINSADALEEFSDHASRDRPVIVYCYHGISSQRAGAYLAAQGFEKVYSIKGGFAAWSEEKGHVE